MTKPRVSDPLTGAIRAGTRGVRRLLLSLVLVPLASLSAELEVPNASFESPSTVFADPRIDGWQKFPKPDWYDESGGFLWEQLAGVFLNTAPGSDDHIENLDGAQALFLFAVPGAGVFQDERSAAASGGTFTNAFEVRFEPGMSYALTVGVVGGAGGMKAGASLEIALYYRDDTGAMQTVAATPVVFDPAVFPTVTRLVDVTVQTPVVQPGDPWANRHLGVRLLSTVDPALSAGYWDLDQVRLAAVRAARLEMPTRAEDGFQVTVQGEPGWRLEVLGTTNAALPAASWNSLAVLTNATGTATFTDTDARAERKFYQARQVR